jgi:predicted DNA-binding transcriptional regulator AlpA
VFGDINRRCYNDVHAAGTSPNAIESKVAKMSRFCSTVDTSASLGMVSGGRAMNAQQQGYHVAPGGSLLIDVHAVADLLGCSPRHVYRLSDGGHMPAPIKLGALVRWSTVAIQEWINKGCPPIRQVKGATR